MGEDDTDNCAHGDKRASVAPHVECKTQLPFGLSLKASGHCFTYVLGSR